MHPSRAIFMFVQLFLEPGRALQRSERMASSNLEQNITAAYPEEELRSHYQNNGRSPAKFGAAMVGLGNNRNATENTIHPVQFYATRLPRSNCVDELLSIIYRLGVP